MEITPRNGPIDPEDCQPLDDVDADATASGLATAASPAGCCCPGKVGDEGNIVAIAKCMRARSKKKCFRNCHLYPLRWHWH